MSTIGERLREYGLYIKQAGNKYNLGWTHGTHKHVIHTFPSRKEAEEAASDMIMNYWEYRMDDFQEYVENYRWVG